MKERKKPVTIKIKSGNTASLKDAHLYLFDKEGELLESANLKSGEATLKTKAEAIEGKTQMIIGPGIPKEFKDQKLNPVLMKKMGGFQPSVRLSKDHEITITGLPELIFPHWLWCLITGGLTKTFNIDGQTQALPVCDARVHICEVDPFYWPVIRVPDYIVDDLAERLKELLINPEIELPPRPPRPLPDPPPFSPRLEIPNFETNEVQKISSLTPLKALPKLPKGVHEGLFSSSQIKIRDTILDNIQLLRPYFCYWPWYWHYFYTCNEIATVYTDCNGKFNFEYLNFTNDKDIYIWVEVNINGQWVTVYRPPVYCNTRWNYPCGTDINIRITDPRVLPCNCGQHLQGELVWFRSIGQYATALHIEQNENNIVNVQGANLRNVGCTDIIDAKRISPFGSTLPFKLLFGDGLPKTGITHYRWKKTRIKNEVLNNTPFSLPTVISGSVRKDYFVITTDAIGNMHFETKSVTLGAEGSGENIGYRIPHWDIYQDPGVPAADKLLTIQWTSPDFWSASIDSTSLDNGLWRFDLELLKLSGGGIFQKVKVPKQVFQVSDYNNSGNSVNAPDNYLNLEVTNPANAFNLRVKARIDNELVTADIQDANITVNSVVEQSGPCGFLHYTQTDQEVEISFIASHPRNFATFGFGVVKGNNTDPISPSVGQSGYVISSVGSYVLSGGIFSRKVTVAQLLGTCSQAAFSENLHVYSLATNGTNRLHGYDRSDTNAFALSTT